MLTVKPLIFFIRINLSIAMSTILKYMAKMLIFISCFVGIKAKRRVLYSDIAQARQCFKCFMELSSCEVLISVHIIIMKLYEQYMTYMVGSMVIEDYFTFDGCCYVSK